MVTRFGVDYAWGDPGVGALKTAGATFVVRYVSYEGNTKNLRRDEADRLREAGIDIVVVFETTGARALDGLSAGWSDARRADTQVQKLGAPDQSVIYFAVDFDAQGKRLEIVNDYLRGACQAIGRDRVGVYGGIRVIKAAFDAGVVQYGWQTYAWSGGEWEPRAQLQQYSNGHKLNGVPVDYCRALKTDFGQWGGQKPWEPVPVSEVGPFPHGKRRLPGPRVKPKWFWLALKEFLARRSKGRTTL